MAFMSLKDIDVSYDKKKQILKGLNLDVEKGELVSLLGPSGCGKTTTLKCLLGTIRRDEGTITLLGHDNQREERAAKLEIGVVLDECFFHDSLRPRDIDLILSRIYQGWDSALYQRYLSKFQLPERKFVKEFSRGMKMKLSLAAALSHRPKLLILDEATSSVDTRTEALVQAAMDRLTEHRTSFVIAHRLSTIKNADLILVLKDGDIIEQGTHKELLAKGGFYADLYNSQFEKAS